MRGRSKVVFQNKDKDNLEGIDLAEDKAAWCFATKAEWYRQTAGQHNRLSNKLTSIATQMKVAAKCGHGQREKDQRNAMINNTLKSYIQLATKLSRKSQLNDTQKEQVMKQWLISIGSTSTKRAIASNRRNGPRSRWRRYSTLPRKLVKC